MKNLTANSKQIQFLFFITLLIFSTPIFGQVRIIERLGGIRLNCLITTEGSNTVNDNAAYLLKRAVSKRINSIARNLGDEETSTNYTSIHLEFESPQKIKSRSKNGKKSKELILKFYSGSGAVLAEFNLLRNRFSRVSNKDSTKNYYSVNLKGVPMTIFEETKVIDITFKNRN